MNVSNDKRGIGWDSLAKAIVQQAVVDYRKSLTKLKLNKDYLPAQKEKNSCERFFRSEWIRQLTDIDGLLIMKTIRKETGYDE